jgi:hypothetical protein
VPRDLADLRPHLPKVVDRVLVEQEKPTYYWYLRQIYNFYWWIYKVADFTQGRCVFRSRCICSRR